MPKSKSTPVYLDHSATTPMSAAALSALSAAFKASWGNPNSVHQIGRQALNLLDTARRQIAAQLDCQPEEIVFTSGGTEADNLAIQGVGLAHPGCHMVVSSIEHKAVLETCKELERRGMIKVTYIKPDRGGVIKTKDVLAAITPTTRLVSLMYVNNEIGTIQPIRELGKQLEKLNQTRAYPVLLHTDAVQAAGYLPLGTKYLHVDLMSISAHKLGGPKGVGLLFARKGLALTPMLHGGGQERGNRSGTVNVPGIISFAAALENCRKSTTAALKRLQTLNRKLTIALAKYPQVRLNSSPTATVPYIINFSVKSHTSDELVIYFDQHNICVSAASACASGSIEPSYVLTNMGLPILRASSSIRISLGRDTTAKDVGRFLAALKNLLQ